MGYYTEFKLKVHPTPSPEDKPAIFSEDFGYWTLGELVDLTESGAVKWYEHETELMAVSSRWPQYTFILDGVGEEHGDEWRKFFQGGRMECVKRPEWEPPSAPSWQAPKPVLEATLVRRIAFGKEAYLLHIPAKYCGCEYVVVSVSVIDGTPVVSLFSASTDGVPFDPLPVWQRGTDDIGAVLIQAGIRVTNLSSQEAEDGK